MKNAATLVELLIVMGIIVILFSIGSAGIFFIKETIEFETSKNILAQKIDNIANMARNSLSLEELELPDYWGFEVDSNTLKVLYCYENDIFLNCSYSGESIAFTNIDIYFQQQCAGIVFETNNTKFLGIRDTLTYSKINSGNCELNLKHSNGQSAIVKFNIDSSFIEK